MSSTNAVTNAAATAPRYQRIFPSGREPCSTTIPKSAIHVSGTTASGRVITAANAKEPTTIGENVVPWETKRRATAAMSHISSAVSNPLIDAKATTGDNAIVSAPDRNAHKGTS